MICSLAKYDLQKKKLEQKKAVLQPFTALYKAITSHSTKYKLQNKRMYAVVKK